MAERIGVSRVTYGRYENDKRELGTGALVRLAAQGVDVAYLLDVETSDAQDAFQQSVSVSSVIESLGKAIGALPEASANLVCEMHRVPSLTHHQAEEAAKAFLAGSLLDPDAFCIVFERLAAAADRLNLSVSWKQAGRAAALLWRLSILRGDLDQTTYEQAARLAATDCPADTVPCDPFRAGPA